MIEEESEGYALPYGHPDIGPHGNRLLMLGVIVKSDAGHAIESGFLGDVARVGDDTLGVGGEPAKLEVTQGIENGELRMGNDDFIGGGDEAGYDLGGFWAQGGDDGRRASGGNEGGEHLFQMGFVGQ